MYFCLFRLVCRFIVSERDCNWMNESSNKIRAHIHNVTFLSTLQRVLYASYTTDNFNLISTVLLLGKEM